MFSAKLVSVLLFLLVLLLFFMHRVCSKISNETEREAFESMFTYAEILALLAFMMSLGNLFHLF
ncbi:hypothetical protein CVD28_02750 [Bacillus sp. M6-12]|uniref:hypothetical protein n=1 Tax=Bacillus sp. M6-12 TaxID=2054166 RepID=UPI000C75B3E8|nr:hypothetical protein [Bacillus sp. M6-12]PLS19351.1 hypothetical protein CVD28_02750 [Bacillus sp. M6-12]